MKKNNLNLLVFILIAGFFITSSCKQENANTDQQENIKKLSQTQETIAVGVFNGNGASPTCVKEAMESLKIDKGIVAVSLSSSEIVKTKLENIDVILFPGGSGSTSMLNLGEQAIEIIQKCVKKDGKGVVGICAGGYLLSNTTNYPSMNLSGAKVIDRDHYNRGNGLVEFELTKQGEDIFPELIEIEHLFIEYYEGPILAPAENPENTYSVLANFVSDVHQKGNAKSGITPGKPYFINTKIGKGKLFVSVGHPESTPGMRWMVPRMVRWVSGKQMISYEGNVIRPNLFSKEVLHNSETDKEIDKLFYQLFDDNNNVQIEAINKLENLRAWSGKKWIPGLLRDNSPKVRERAAKYLADNEITYELPELKSAILAEKNKKTIEKLSEYETILESLID
ncbi:MAG: BPL-N domain-containing protein [Bacteroidales bacterium]|jgi:glutamine amidotransferase-like uncharacterized protein|nr:BPL-N domain-containing protein [Bacteroidales bacterium]